MMPITSSVPLRDIFGDLPALRAIDVELEMHHAGSVEVRLDAPLNNGLTTASDAFAPGTRSNANIVRIDFGFNAFNALTREDRGELILTVRSFGESAGVSAIVLETADEWIVGRPYEGCSGSSNARYRIERVRKPARPTEIGPAEYITLMQDRLRREANHPLAEARQFFFQLDCATHKFLHPEGNDERENLKTILMNRCARRAGLLATCQDLNQALPADSELDRIRGLFGLYRGLVTNCFASPIPGHKQALIDFSRGATRFRLVQFPDVDAGMWTTQPSSGYFFLFAELLLLAAQDARIKDTDPQDVHFWNHAAEGAILAQPVFAAAFGKPDVVHRGWDGFDPCQLQSIPQSVLDTARNQLTPDNETPSYENLIRMAAANARTILPALVAGLRCEERMPQAASPPPA